jgi:hypothetical protein
MYGGPGRAFAGAAVSAAPPAASRLNTAASAPRLIQLDYGPRPFGFAVAVASSVFRMSHFLSSVYPVPLRHCT